MLLASAGRQGGARCPQRAAGRAHAPKPARWGQRAPPRKVLAAVYSLAFTALAFAAEAPKQEEHSEDERDDVTLLNAINVQADRLEDFGFRVGWHLGNPLGSTLPRVIAVYPNTAASKGGLRPGEKILRSDHQSAAITLFSLGKWRKLRERKLAEIASGKKTVTWTLELE